MSFLEIIGIIFMVMVACIILLFMGTLLILWCIYREEDYKTKALLEKAKQRELKQKEGAE